MNKSELLASFDSPQRSDLRRRPQWLVTDIKLHFLESGSPLQRNEANLPDAMGIDLHKVIVDAFDKNERGIEERKQHLWSTLTTRNGTRIDRSDIYYDFAPTVAHFYEKITTYRDRQLALLEERSDQETLRMRKWWGDWCTRSLSYAPELYGYEQIGIYTGSIPLPETIDVNAFPFLNMIYDGGPTLTRDGYR
jgi:hypothetical protein